jgi:ABC-type transporter Mla maintaining outer membrane lipid asymmetry permease subunit MlaE
MLASSRITNGMLQTRPLRERSDKHFNGKLAMSYGVKHTSISFVAASICSFIASMIPCIEGSKNAATSELSPKSVSTKR